VDVERLVEDARLAGEPVLHVHPPFEAGGSVALLSGSFDPVTVGHLAVAKAALPHAERVVLVYAARTIPKEPDAPEPLLDERSRLAALDAVCRSRPWLAVGISSHGLLVEQVRAARNRFGDAELFAVMGSDKVLQVLDPRWYPDRDAALEELFGAAIVLYAVRAGQEEDVADALGRPANARWSERFIRLPVPPDVAALSSREVRRRLRAGAEVHGLVPDEALASISAGRGSV
jgi:nicotinamide-nucleotide adenylyltransferase